MASLAYEGNYKAYLLATAPASWAGGVEGARSLTATELTGGTRLLRLVSAGAVAYTYNQNTASQALVDEGKISHNLGTREITGMSVTHEADFPLDADAMWNLYGYGDKGYLVISPAGVPATTGEILHVFETEVSEAQTQPSAQDTIQNFMVTFAVQDWDLNVSFTTP